MHRFLYCKWSFWYFHVSRTLLPAPRIWTLRRSGPRRPPGGSKIRLSCLYLTFLIAKEEEGGGGGRMRERGRGRERETMTVNSWLKVTPSIKCPSPCSSALQLFMYPDLLNKGLHHGAFPSSCSHCWCHQKAPFRGTSSDTPTTCGLCDSGYWGNCPLTTWRIL